MKKLNKKALFGVGAGILTAAVAACCLAKGKKSDDSEVCCDDEYVEVDESVESDD